jgi:glycerophosphoryl diester phosphodiesterase
MHENTIEAFEAAIFAGEAETSIEPSFPSTKNRPSSRQQKTRWIRAGADAIELDLRRTADSIIVIHHDERLENCNHTIGETSYEAMSDHAEELGYKIPTLEETLKTCAGKIALNLELKEHGYEEKIIEMTRQYYDLANIAFSSFDDASVKRIKELEPQAIAGLLLGIEPPARIATRIGEIFPVTRARDCRADFIAPNWRLLRFGYIRRMNRASLPLIVWTVNQTPTARRLIKKNVAAIISDVPENVSPLVDE